MPNCNQHLIIGALATGGVCLILELCKSNADPEHQVDLSRVASWAALGTLAAALPDLIEPAHHPRHRGFAHSMATGTAAVYLLQSDWLNRACDPVLADMLRPLLVGYLSHLGADSETPMGLPFV